MKATTIIKISPIVETLSPILLQCKSGECGGCPNNTGKMLWVPKIWQVGGIFTLNLQYNFFDKSAESVSPIKYNIKESNIAFDNRPDKAYATTTPAQDNNPALSPSLMRLGNTQLFYIDVYASSTVGCWLFFRQTNPAIANVHDALCFEYNNEKKLITFRSF